jgi:hypothetical protein
VFLNSGFGNILGKYKTTEISVDFGDLICIYAKGKKSLKIQKILKYI